MLSALFSGDFDRYFAEAGQGSPLWLFVHVPKTAGSSLEVDLASQLQPHANIEIDYTDTTKPYALLFDEAVERFIRQHGEAPYRFASGHIVARHTERIREAVPDVRCLAMMRNPVARLISDYRYQRSPMNLAREAFIRNTPDFQTYVARKFVHNKTATALVPRPIVDAVDVGAAIKYVMQNYTFIGMQEMYPLGLLALTTLMGKTRGPEARVRVNTGAEDKVVLTPEQDAELRRLNTLDMALFHAFSEKWRNIREDLRAYLARRQQSKAA